MGESVHVIVLDTFVAVIAGVIMFCACFTYGLEVNAGPKPLFDYNGNSILSYAGRTLVGCVVLLVYGICSDVYRARCL